MKNSIILLTIMLFSFAMAAQTEVREVGNFTKLDVIGSFEVWLVDGKPGTVTIEGDKEAMEFITTKVKGGVLTIVPPKSKTNVSYDFSGVVIKVPVATLNEIAFKGSGSVTGKETIRQDIKLSLFGSGSIDVDVQAGNVEALATGSGDITLNGKVSNFKCEILGSGDIKAQDLESSSVSVSVNGSGNANVNSKKEIIGMINGSGDILYTGDPVKKEFKRNGSGDSKSH
jgi:hypothetical protein